MNDEGKKDSLEAEYILGLDEVLDFNLYATRTTPANAPPPVSRPCSCPCTPPAA